MKYVSDRFNETQWQYIKKELKIQERKQKHDLYQTWNAIT